MDTAVWNGASALRNHERNVSVASRVGGRRSSCRLITMQIIVPRIDVPGDPPTWVTTIYASRRFIAEEFERMDFPEQSFFLQCALEEMVPPGTFSAVVTGNNNIPIAVSNMVWRDDGIVSCTMAHISDHSVPI